MMERKGKEEEEKVVRKIIDRIGVYDKYVL